MQKTVTSLDRVALYGENGTAAGGPHAVPGKIFTAEAGPSISRVLECSGKSSLRRRAIGTVLAEYRHPFSTSNLT